MGSNGFGSGSVTEKVRDLSPLPKAPPKAPPKASAGAKRKPPSEAKLSGAAERFSEERILLIPPRNVKLAESTEDRLYDPRVELPPRQELIDSFLARGWDETKPPILVEKRADGYWCVAGRGRVKAAREALGKSKGEILLRARILRDGLSDLEVFEVLFSENALRADDDPLTEARKIARYLQLCKEEGVAEALARARVRVIAGCSDDSLRNKLSLLKASEPVKAMLARSELTVTDVYQLVREHGPHLDAMTAAALGETKDPTRQRRSGDERTEGGRGKGRPSPIKVKALLLAVQGARKCPDALAALGYAVGKASEERTLAYFGVDAEDFADAQRRVRAANAKKRAEREE